MENYNDILSKNIQTLRKQNNMTQEELASVCNISFQAISKWENSQTSPDITLLPILAKTFNVSIDCLFSENLKTDDQSDLDDSDVKVVVFRGRTQIHSEEIKDNKIYISLNGKIKNLYSYANITIDGDLTVENNMEVSGNLTTDDLSSKSILVEGNLTSDDIKAETITVNMNVTSDDIETKSLEVNQNLTADDIKSDKITVNQNLTLDTLECDELHIGGNIMADSVNVSGIS